MIMTENALQELAKEMMALSDKAGSAGETDISDTWCSASTMVSRLAMQTQPPKPAAPDFREEIGADGKPNGWLNFGAKPAGAVPLPEPEWLTLLRKELFLAAMKSNFTLTRDELQHLINLGDAREAAGRAVVMPLVDASFEAFNEITGLCSNLREGGPAPEDLEGLSSGLESAIEIAANMLAKISDARSAPIPQQPAAEGAGREAVAWQFRDMKWKPGVWADITRAMYDSYQDGNATGKRGKDWDIRELYDSPTPAADAGGVTVVDARSPNFLAWCGQWFGPDSDESYLAKAVNALTPEVRHGE